MKCKYCNYIKNIGRSEAQGRNIYGRKHYYCKHPDRDKINDFVGYGDNSFSSELTLKTRPRWCPMKKE